MGGGGKYGHATRRLMTAAGRSAIRMSRDEMTAYDFAEAIKAYELGNELGERVIRTR